MKKLIPWVMLTLFTLGTLATALANTPPGQQGYEGQPGNQGNGQGGYEGQPGNQGGG